jgi:NADH-quinone oxidoreductase subunit G
MPCTSRKYESGRTDYFTQNGADVNFVLTTRELIQLIRMNGLDLNSVEPENADQPLSSGSTLSGLQGLTGSTLDSILKTIYYQHTGRTFENKSMFEFDSLSEGYKTGVIIIGNAKLNVAVINGLKNSVQLTDAIRNKKRIPDIVEIMACFGGCICGGGQPFSMKEKDYKKLLLSATASKNPELIHAPFQNKAIHDITDKIIGKPMSEMNLTLFHKQIS